MPELLDVLDEKGNRTGKTIIRGQILQEGEYVATVLIFLCNREGEYLIQKRSMMKTRLPGIWDVTAGVVSSGEESCEAAVREVQEEIGITLVKENIYLLQRVRRIKDFADLYLAIADFELSDCVLQEEEVDEVRFVTSKELKQLICEAIDRMDIHRIDFNGSKD